MPEIVKTRGYILFIFGSIGASIYHLNPFLYQPSGYQQVGLIDLVSDIRKVEPTFTITYVSMISCASIDQRTAHVNFLLGGSHLQHMESFECYILDVPNQLLTIEVSRNPIFRQEAGQAG